MKVSEFIEKSGYGCLTGDAGLGNEITGAYVGDLLSWVMAKGTPGCIWTTVQTHLNVVAVAALHDFACVVIPDDIAVPEETLKKAAEEEIPVLSAPVSSYGVCKLLCSLGVDEA